MLELITLQNNPHTQKNVSRGKADRVRKQVDEMYKLCLLIWGMASGMYVTFWVLVFLKKKKQPWNSDKTGEFLILGISK